MLAGRCLCGKINFTVIGPALTQRVCWCTDCQRLGGGSCTVNIAFRTADILVLGETKRFVSIADSGQTMHREFCPECGTPIFSRAESRSEVMFVRAGTMIDSDFVKPEIIIWSASAPGWAWTLGDLPRAADQPKPVGG